MCPEDLLLHDCLHVAQRKAGRGPRNVSESPPCPPVATIGGYDLAGTEQEPVTASVYGKRLSNPFVAGP